MIAMMAIDPGTTQSGVACWAGGLPFAFGKKANEDILILLRGRQENDVLVIEEINPYTMGKSTRDTILWSGRFQEAWEARGRLVVYISRDQVRRALCGSGGSAIDDTVIRHALVDEFAYGEKNFGKGTKKQPGFFYGFKEDIWQAFALAVAYAKINRIRWRQ